MILHKKIYKTQYKNLLPSFCPNESEEVQPETLPKNSNFSSCLQNIKLKNNTT
jgi:hypothetical protein